LSIFNVKAQRVKIPPNVVRDFMYMDDKSSTFTLDLIAEHGVIGLDWLVVNRGGSDITVTIDNTHSIVIPSSASRGADNVKYGVIKVTSTAVDYSIMIAGIKMEA